MVDLVRSIQVAVSGLKAQSGRMRVIAENLANADSTGTAPGADAYRRRVPTFQSRLDRTIGAQTVALGRIESDNSDFRIRHEPGHPAADANGNVKYPNVNSLIETMDMREAQRSYEANLNVIGTTRRIVQRTLDILRG